MSAISQQSYISPNHPLFAAAGSGGGGGSTAFPPNISAATLYVSTISQNYGGYLGASNDIYYPISYDQLAPVGSNMNALGIKVRQRANDVGAIVSLDVGTDFKNGNSYINSYWDGYILMPLEMNIASLTVQDETGICMTVNNQTTTVPELSTVNINLATINNVPYSLGAAPITQLFMDVKPNGTGGGVAPVTGSFFTRNLNTGIPALSGSNSAVISGMSLSSNQITVPLGTYIVSASVPGCRVGRHKCQLYNATTSQVLVLGQNGYAADSIYNQTASAFMNFTLVVSGSPQVLLLQQCCELTQSNSRDLGLECAFGDNEIYSQISFTRIA